jgi:hypothetical protein
LRSFEGFTWLASPRSVFPTPHPSRLEAAPELLGNGNHHPEEAPSPESLAALEQGQRLLDDALRTRRWGDAQAEELRSLSAALTFHQQQQLTQKLIVSINRGDLVVETTGFPF